MNVSLWRDGIFVLLRAANEAANAGQAPIAQALLFTVFAAIQEVNA